MSKTLKIVSIIVLILFIVGAAAIYLGWRFIGGFIERAPEEVAEMFEKYEQEIPLEEIKEAIEKEEAIKETEKEEVEEEEEDLYETVRTVVPMTPRNEVMHEHFKRVLEEVFEKEPKLVGSGDITALAYIVNRVITPDDIIQTRDLLEQEGYELSHSKAEDWRYELRFSAEILDREYGAIFVIFSTSEEMEEYTQRIEVRIL